MENTSGQHGIATPSSMEEYMSRAHLPRLTIQSDGTVIIGTPDDLDQLSECPIHDLSTETLMFVYRQWLERNEEERASIAAFLNAAREQVCNEGRLPPPPTALPPVGVRVESVVTGKPGPEHAGTVWERSTVNRGIQSSGTGGSKSCSCPSGIALRNADPRHQYLHRLRPHHRRFGRSMEFDDSH